MDKAKDLLFTFLGWVIFITVFYFLIYSLVVGVVTFSKDIINYDYAGNAFNVLTAALIILGLAAYYTFSKD